MSSPGIPKKGFFKKKLIFLVKKNCVLGVEFVVDVSFGDAA